MAPVLEAGFDWLPDLLDHVRLTVAREIDDPDEISAIPYTLTQAKFSLRPQQLRKRRWWRFPPRPTMPPTCPAPDQETIYRAGATCHGSSAPSWR